MIILTQGILMRNAVFVAGWSFLSFGLLFSNETSSVPTQDTVIVGGGIVGAFEAYYAYLDALKTNEKPRITVYEKGQSFAIPPSSTTTEDSTNTSFNIIPSLTIDEILSVVPRGSELVEKLAILFSEPGGIRVDDVLGVNDSKSATEFKKAVELYGKDQNHDDRTQTLLMLGKMSMNLWKDLYENADEELKSILEESNYNPCRDPKNTNLQVLHDGYRIDLIYGVPDAKNRASGMQATYEQLGYNDCKILSPSEVMTIDPSLTDFCKEHSSLNLENTLCWNNDSVGLWRPGGCIDTRVFLPKFYTYLQKLMGTYTSKSGKTKDCFRLKFNKEVSDVEYENSTDLHITGLAFSDGSSKQKKAEYVFCPGEAVGTLHKFGFYEPAYAGFAGPSLLLNIPLSANQLDSYQNFSHCMEVHKVGIVLAWQARVKEDKIFIGVGGTKSFYGDLAPNKEEAFAKNRHLVQLNMINDVLPEMVSLACGYPTKGLQLTSKDLSSLEEKGILNRWVGRRAVAYDGFPTLGSLYYKDQKVSNARCTTHLGSGGVSFAPAAVRVSRDLSSEDPFIKKTLRYADSKRTPENT